MLSKRSRVCLAAGLCASGHLPSCAGFSVSPPRTTSLPLQAAFSSGSVRARTGSSVVRSRTTRVRSTVDVEPLVGVVETDTTTLTNPEEVRRIYGLWMGVVRRALGDFRVCAVAPCFFLRHIEIDLMKNGSKQFSGADGFARCALVKAKECVLLYDRTTAVTLTL